ncbi:MULTISPECIES: cytochrome P450 [unclassified Mycolicibacterium]|uniref:cytochrome P450 n=1 Tax=unclassified Mycolicibacterium TaxID=2636767 RepID=UPI0012DC3DE1|nr:MULTISPECIES: cytochrome P450 [unclassified Mycolicibacterium]MUL83051.1 cytochrome P450 [Mycolicibacterium sp. CBMA 329]MUL89386.1 cytochrome P450 [Mycolicibacterium sp. CBMA 331]MUL99075.1 cytochrome P450 [Mycolicibacterium sp. CBMA 334]MUM24701.1 cytochrome P450 [Mycolicibacterium sp. CBMA 295]MUM38902.1 cytochrome P450 [Mycolicibacterium sp. CBMA 247]
MTIPDLTAPRLPWDAADPYPFYETRRHDGDVVWNDTAQAWLVLGYHAARDVLVGTRWTSDPRANMAAAGAVEFFNPAFVEASMLFTDGLAHDRLRGAVRDVFGRTFINRLTDGIESICHDTVSTIPVDQTFDAMSQIAIPLPIAVIGAWLGLDTDQCTALREHSPTIIRILGGLADQEELEHGIGAAAALIADMLPAAADRRTHPRDDLLSYIAADPSLALDEVVITAILIAVAGHETTANLLGASLIRLLAPDDGGTCLADHIDPADPAVITELMRLDSPVQATGRTATADQTIAGIDIRCGETVLACIAAANRDPAVYDDPDLFRPGRPGPAPLTFGHGAHYCLGAPLARLETTAALRHILRRRPALVGTPTWRGTPAIRGPLTVPIRLST